MAVLYDSHNIDYHPMSDILLKTVLSSLSILVAFCLRDTITTGISLVVPAQETKKFLFSLLITVFFLFLTVFTAWYCQDHLDS
jgi:phosphate starvation-inducible membrane PsiE